MSQAPIMPLKTDALISDTTHLSAEEFGAYMLILIATWRNNGKPLPDDDVRLARVTRSVPTRWATKLRRPLSEFFDISSGYWVQKRLTETWESTQKIIAQRRHAGLESAKARVKPKPLETKEIASTHDAVPLEQTITITKGKEESGSSLSADSESVERSEKERELPSTGLQKKYTYTGKVIRLTAVDFKRWRESYPAIPDLRAALSSLDDWYANNLSLEERRDWFPRCSRALQNQNQEFSLRSQLSKPFLTEHGVTRMHPGAGG